MRGIDKMDETSKNQGHNLKATVRAEITESNQPSVRRGFWKVWARGARPGANELMLNELIQNKHQSIDPAFKYDQDTAYLAYVNTIQSPGDIQLGLCFDDFQSDLSDKSASPVVQKVEEKKGPDGSIRVTKIPGHYDVYLAGPSSIAYPFSRKGSSSVIHQTDKRHSNMQSASVCNSWLNIRPINGFTLINESPVASLEVSTDDSKAQQIELNRRSQVYKTYLKEFVYPLTKRNIDTLSDKQTEILTDISKSDIYDKYSYQNRDIFVHLIPRNITDQESVASALASLLILKAKSLAYAGVNASFEDIKLNLTLKSNSPIFKNTILRSEAGEYNSKETFGDPKIGFQWYYPKRDGTDSDYIVQFGVPELCCEFLSRNSLDRYPKPFTLDWSEGPDSNSIKIDILAQIFRILLYANASYVKTEKPEDMSPVDVAYDKYREGVNRSWEMQGSQSSDYWSKAALEEQKYISKYYHSSNKARIVQDIKALFCPSDVKPYGTLNSTQIPRGLYISLGQNPWSPYYSENPDVEGLLSKDYADPNFRSDERLTDITLDLSLDDQLIITELGGSSVRVDVKEGTDKNFQKSLSFTFKPYARGCDKNSNDIALAKFFTVNNDGDLSYNYSDFHYDNFVRASKDLANKKNNKFFIYNLKNNKEAITSNDSMAKIYNYVRYVHKSPDEYKIEDYHGIATSQVNQNNTIDFGVTTGIERDKLFTTLSPSSSIPSIELKSTKDFMIGHNYVIETDTKKKIKETTYRNVSLYLVGILNYYQWNSPDSFNILAYTTGPDNVLSDPIVEYSILGVPVTEADAYTKLNTWLYDELSGINNINDNKINVIHDLTEHVYPQRASSTLLKNMYGQKRSSLANKTINKDIIFDPPYADNKTSITPGNKYGTAPVNYYYIAIAIDYTKKETIENDTAAEITFAGIPFNIDFVKRISQNQYDPLYSLKVDFEQPKEY